MQTVVANPMTGASEPSHVKGGCDGSWQLGVKKITLSVSRSIQECDVSVVEYDPLVLPRPPGDDGAKIAAPRAAQPIPVPPKTIVQYSTSRVSSNDVVALEAGELDPLSALMANLDADNTQKASSPAWTSPQSPASKPVTLPPLDPTNEFLDEWTIQKDLLFQTFAAERFHITIDAHDDATDSDVKKKVVYTDADTASSTCVIKRARARLEQLDSKDVVDEPTTVQVSQSEYISRIKALQQDFLEAWHDDQKVLALRITIKCIKLLGDTTFPKFYPCMFVLVCDVLDCFGAHVFNRIKAKAEEHHALPHGFTSGDVDIEAKETCRNWFYKTACIRELLPRIYTEIALLRCYRFLCDGEFPHIVARLSNMIKGVGDVTVALYARTYLALASSRVLVGHHASNVMLQSMQDYMRIMHRFGMDKAVRFYTDTESTESELHAIHAPGVHWLMKSIALAATEVHVDALLHQYKQFAENSMVLEQIVTSFPGKLLAPHTMELVQLIRQTNHKEELFRCLSLKLVEAPPPAHEKLVFLNEVWGTITRLLDIHAYLRCAAAFVALLVTHYSSREVVILLKDVVRHLNASEAMDAAMYQALEDIMEVIIMEARRQTHYFTTIVPSSEFLTLLGMFQHSTNITLSKRLLTAFVRGRDKGLRLAVEGPHASIVHILLSICTRVHDALDSLSTSLEIHEASQAICTFVNCLDMSGVPHEGDGLLNMYVECRRVFYKLDRVKACLVRRVLWLSVLVDCHMRRSFVKGCLAYCHITIPSLVDGIEKLKLMTLCAKIALASQCLPQMDAFVKAAIVLMTELPSAKAAAQADSDQDALAVDVYEQHAMHAMTDLLSLLVVVPSTGDPLYFVNGFRNAMSKFPWLPTLANHTRMLVHLVPFLAAWVPDQELPYAIGHVPANDVLFGGSAALATALADMLTSVIEEILDQLHGLVQDPQQRDHRNRVNLQSDILLDLINTLVTSVELNAHAASRLVNFMTGLVAHHALLHDDIKTYWRNTKAFIVCGADHPPSTLGPRQVAPWHHVAHSLHSVQML
ncbi:hypothetical protein, variant 1 [Aphanomyces invadans]|uniref:Uncharacterized protein n=1 Tax=Aphanomyces invadans TaxID=157072 RepID=A0A024TLR7_9STRA|nr:hypothetical protein, variant 1 [Aphanomyces invadans]ETV94904.1 hypothetical protein, variant 1 [Aphanomyces invadans]|eukprot:XP_008876496.1 hypothetical protein, variant 1 [Aphanomyces invadans]